MEISSQPKPGLMITLAQTPKLPYIQRPMHIGLLFYADTLIMAGTAGGIKGRAIANNGFLRALLSHATGHEITIIVSSEIEKQLFQPFLTGFIPSCPVEFVSLLRLTEHLKKKPLDVLHVLDVNLYKGFQLRARLSDKNFPVTGVTHTLGHAPFFEWMQLNLSNNPASFDRLICTTPTAEQVIDKIQSAIIPALKNPARLNTAVIPLGIFPEIFQAKKSSFRQSNNIPADTVLLLSLGRLNNITKVDLIPQIVAFKSVFKNTTKDLRWILAGAAEHKHYAQFLQKVIQDEKLDGKIILVPNPDEEQKMALYQEADIFVALSDNTQETFGLSVIEALAAGLPVIASDWDGYRCLVTHNETGILIPTLTLPECDFLDSIAALQRDSFNQLGFAQAVATDNEKFVAAVLELAHNDSQRKTMGQRARETSQNYHWAPVISKYLNLWQELARQAQYQSKDNSKISRDLDYHRIFADYASQNLNKDHHVQITVHGQKCLRREAQLYRLYDMEEILDLELMAGILKSSPQATALGTLHGLLAPQVEEIINYHVLWLYKFGLLKIDQP